jgi:hypothetical protein
VLSRIHEEISKIGQNERRYIQREDLLGEKEEFEAEFNDVRALLMSRDLTTNDLSRMYLWKESLPPNDRDKIIEWFSPINLFMRQADIFHARVPETGEWFIKDDCFKRWETGSGGILWCPGMRAYSGLCLIHLLITK